MALFLFFLFCLFCSVLFRVALFWLVLCCLLGDSVVVDLMCSCLSKVDLDGVLVFIYEFVPCCNGIKYLNLGSTKENRFSQLGLVPSDLSIKSLPPFGLSTKRSRTLWLGS
jgi:hypothetical protein